MTIKMYVDGVEYIPGEEKESEAVAVEMWYDRHRREWVLYTVDENGYQVSDTRYAFTKTEANVLKRELEKVCKKGEEHERVLTDGNDHCEHDSRRSEQIF